MLEEAFLLGFAELHQHHHEEEEHHDAAGVDQELGHTHEFGPEAEVAARHGEHGQQKAHDAVDGVLGEDHGPRAGQGDEAEDQENVLADLDEQLVHGGIPGHFSSSATENLATGDTPNMFWKPPSMARDISSRL